MSVGAISASRRVYCQHSHASEFKQQWRCQRVEELKLNESRGAIMKAIAVKPGIPNTVHLTELPAPQVGDIPNGRGVLVRVLRLGGDGTDKQINAAEYGQAPPGYDFL